MKIHPVGAKLFHTDRHKKSKSCFLQFANTPKKVPHRYEHLHSSDSQAAITALDSFQPYSNLVWDYDQSIKSWYNWQNIAECKWYGCQDSGGLTELQQLFN